MVLDQFSISTTFYSKTKFNYIHVEIIKQINYLISDIRPGRLGGQERETHAGNNEPRRAQTELLRGTKYRVLVFPTPSRLIRAFSKGRCTSQRR